FWPTPAFSNEVLHIYIATELSSGKNCPDDDEFVENVIVSYKEALQMVKNGKIKDSKTIIALTYLGLDNK
ncbi:MAG: ADP-ribose pyrophosphatase, partial [Endomicrobiaceae bacterium]|nr:ADP-ribose pyrophosphatase [Endomicrobiaceae bacterium]